MNINNFYLEIKFKKMQSNIQTNNEPIPPKYLRTHFQKFRSSKIKRQEQNYPQKLKSHTKQNRIVTEIDEQLQLTYNNIKQHQANYFSFSQVINKKYPQSQFQNKDQVINQSFFNTLKYSTVKDYVHYIYLNYNIKDPLQNTFCQTPKHKITKQKKQSQTRKKIMSLKQNFQQELNSQSTTKKERATDNQNRQSFLTKRQTDVSQFLLRNSYLNNSYHSNHSYNVINNQQIQHIKQEFRYCFMCGQAVLTANIQYHENTCEPLRRAYNMNIDQLLKIINQKISQIKTQIHEKFIQKDKTQLGQMLFGIQTVMKNQISIQNCKQTSEQVKVYEIIQEQIQKSNLLAVFDLMSRLKWFSYLKINMQRHRVKKQQPYWKNNI